VGFDEKAAVGGLRQNRPQRQNLPQGFGQAQTLKPLFVQILKGGFAALTLFIFVKPISFPPKNFLCGMANNRAEQRVFEKLRLEFDAKVGVHIWGSLSEEGGAKGKASTLALHPLPYASIK
jgi:hypothetical protein